MHVPPTSRFLISLRTCLKNVSATGTVPAILAQLRCAGADYSAFSAVSGFWAHRSGPKTS